jgi:crossover junction endodeoxyribonuclease RuvC
MSLEALRAARRWPEPAAKLTPEEVEQIRQEVARRAESQRAIARRFNMSEASISRIATGRSWREVTPKMHRTIIAIDIGVSGAIALLTAEGHLLEVSDMPVLNDGPSGRRAVNAPLLAEIVFESHATQAFIEFVGARPGEGRAEAIRRWPSHASLFARVKDDGRAEAALIGVAGLLKNGGVK